MELDQARTKPISLFSSLAHYFLYVKLLTHFFMDLQLNLGIKCFIQIQAQISFTVPSHNCYLDPPAHSREITTISPSSSLFFLLFLLGYTRLLIKKILVVSSTEERDKFVRLCVTTGALRTTIISSFAHPFIIVRQKRQTTRTQHLYLNDQTVYLRVYFIIMQFNNSTVHL